MKALAPTLKERKRYILFKIFTDLEVEKAEVLEQVTKACLQFLGQLGVARAGPQFLPESWDKKNKTGIIRIGHKYVNEAKAALALVKEIGEARVTFACLLVSGSIKKLKEAQKKVK